MSEAAIQPSNEPTKLFLMEQTSGARRTEDIALDLMKFIATTVHIAKPVSGSTGFGATGAAPKPEDQIAQILDLYARCKQAVEAK